MSEQYVKLAIVDFVNLHRIEKFYKGFKADLAGFIGCSVSDRVFNRVFNSITL